MYGFLNKDMHTTSCSSLLSQSPLSASLVASSAHEYNSFTYNGEGASYILIMSNTGQSIKVNFLKLIRG